MKKILFLLAIPLNLIAQKDYPALLDKYMQARANANEFTGTVLVAKKGKIIYEKAFGMADRELNVPNAIQTKFEIGSITKQFTAAAILQLVQAGKICLDDKLNRYFPDFPKADSVTIQMLLTHTSGIKNYTEIPEFSKICTLPFEKDTMVALIKKQPFDFSPGSQMSYSSSGYYLLGYIIEKVTGKSYSDYVFENVIQKAGLKNTSVNRWDTVLSYRAKGYRKTPTEWKNAFYISMEGPYSAGAIISTTEDLYQWNNALFSDKILSRDLFTKMTTPYLNHYGYGLIIDTFQNHLRIAHSGGIPGFASSLSRFPSDEVIIAGLSNNENTHIDGIVNSLACIIFDIPLITPYKHKGIMLDSLQLNRFVGKYTQEGATKADTIKTREGKIYWHPWWGREYLLKPESKTKIFLDDANMWDLQFEFDMDSNGKISKSYAIIDGIKSQMKKED
jgi:CubicO group peptidase (beta-lactamase class C family)